MATEILDLIKRDDILALIIKDINNDEILPSVQEYLFSNLRRKIWSIESQSKYGKWILECDAEGYGDNLYKCSECRTELGCDPYDLPKYCGECGARLFYNVNEDVDEK
jgi:DNA-directed RNA polymerase subunit RPC12/RpoP